MLNYRACYIVTDLNNENVQTSIKTVIRRNVPNLKISTLYDFTDEMVEEILKRGFNNPQIEFSHYYQVGPKRKKHPFRKGVFL